MLSSMLQLPCNEGNADPVGTVITTGNIETHNMHSRTDMLHYKEQYGSITERLRALRFE